MFGAFVGGFAGFMGMYAAYRIVRSVVLAEVVKAAKQGWKEGTSDSEKPAGDARKSGSGSL